MAGGISLHVVDATIGRPARGMRVEVFALTPTCRLIAAGTLGADGTLDHPLARGAGIEAPGLFEAVFHIGAYFRAAGLALPEPAFLEEAPFRFGVADIGQHYHLPLKTTPWGFSMYRGG